MTLFAMIFALTAQAGVVGNDKCMVDAGSATGCTANDIGIQDIKITKIIDGCVSDTDTAIVNIDMAVTSANPARYDIGLFVDIGGGNAQDTGNTCVHEALFPVLPKNQEPTDAERNSGIGGFYLADNDSCGDVHNGLVYNRTIVDGDVASGSTTPMEIEIACSDSTGNGYLDVAWGATWSQNANGINCTSIADAVAGTNSKCQVGVTDSSNAENPIPIGIPDLTLTITCSPDGLKAGETTTCTVDYANANNANTGPADFIEFHLDYNETYGSVGNFVFATNPSGNDAASDTGDYINWIIDANQTQSPADRATLANIPKNSSGKFTFDYTVDAGYDDSTTRAVDFVATAFFNNDGSTGVEQNLTASDTVYLPVTVNYAYPRKNGNKIDIDFGTASETGNIGFNIYAVKGKKWTKLNTEIIPGSLDSFEPRDYHTSVAIPEGMKVKKIGITGIDLNGVEDRHGPFKIGRESGSKSKAVKVNWKKVNKQVKADKKARKAAKKAARKAIKQTLKDQTITLNVSQNAVYRVTHDDLLAQGIDLRGQKAKKIAISFRGEGIARHIEGLNKKKRWTNNSWIEFMGTKLNTTDALYVDANHYQLSLNKKLVVETNMIKPLTQKEIVIEKNKRYLAVTPANDPFYEARFFTLNADSPKEYISVFDMPMVPEKGKASIHIDTAVITEGTHKMSVYLNGVQVANASIEGKTAWPLDAVIDSTLFQTTGNELKFVLQGENDGLDLVIYDKMTVTFDDGEEVASQIPTIELAEKITKKSVQPKKGINYVIITHSLFMGNTLDRYVKQREGEGWKIKVVNIEEIYAAYDSGMSTPVAIKAYLKDAIKRGVTHVQLIGAASYDYHDYLGLGSVSLIPSAYAMTSGYIRYTPSDSSYVSDDDGLPMAAIGRWPVRTLEGFENVVNKTLAWEVSGQSSQKTALLIADQEDRGYSFSKQLDKMAVVMSEKGWNNIEYVYLDNEIQNANGDISAGAAAARQKVTQLFSEGPSILAYNGHGSPLGWSSQHLLDAKDIVNITNNGQTTITLPFACQSTYADSPYTNTMAHQLLTAGENGAVAMYGSAAMSTYGDNGIATGKVVKGLMMGHTLGDSIKEAKRSLGATYRDVIRSGNLIGDVTLELK